MSRKQKGVLATVAEEEDVPKHPTVSFVPFAQKGVGLHLLAVLRKVPGGRSADVSVGSLKRQPIAAIVWAVYRLMDTGEPFH